MHELFLEIHLLIQTGKSRQRSEAIYYKGTPKGFRQKKPSENRLDESTNRMIMRIELFYTYPHWFRLRWFGMLVEHAARHLNLHYFGYPDRTIISFSYV